MEIFGRYRLLHRVAVGGMAEIFLARSAGIDGFEKDLVIKRIRPEYGQEEKFASMFIDEAKISISLTHQNIVQVFDFGQHDGSYYLAMEHVFGCDLDEVFSLDDILGKGLDAPLAIFIMQEACRGLDYAHTKKSRQGVPLNIVHRDISPQNIMVTFDGGVKLTDFGIAKARGNVSHTEPGMVLGKLSYMSPEHATGATIDKRADIFACGVVLWEMLVGERVYAGDAGPELFRRIRNAEIDPPSTRSSNVPQELDALVMKAVSRDPEERFQTAREMGNELHSFLSRHFPDFSSYDLQSFLDRKREELDVVGFEDFGETAREAPAASQAEPSVSGHTAPRLMDREPAQPAPDIVVSRQVTPPPAPVSAEFDWTPELIEVIEGFRRKPSLWRLLKMGDVCAAAYQADAACAFYRAAAVKFAQRGLFAQAVLCAKRMLKHRPAQELSWELVGLPQLAGRSNLHISTSLFRTEGEVEHLILELLADTDPSHGMVGEGTPLLCQLDGRDFAQFAIEAPLQHFPIDTNIVEQGQEGDTMYLIARGRVLIHARNSAGERVYLSSLTAGDFFGENSFFTGAPRSATVEALYPVDAFEIDKPLYGRVMRESAQANQILLKFYKERIVDVMLARSRIFGLLSNDDRRAIIDRFDLRVFEPGQTIIKEGELSDQIYVIKNGEAEVYSDRGGVRHTVATLGSSTIFGEVAALRGIPRTASVRATTKLETLCLPGADFHTILDKRPEVRQKVLEVVGERARENLDRLRLQSPFG